MFERFTDRARRVLVEAQIEAGELSHNFIGTEHLLLGLMKEGEGVAAKALTALNVTHQSLREQVQTAVAPVESLPETPPPFTPRAKKVLELGLREALQLGHNYIGTEHMLLGIIRYGDNTATRVLQNLGVETAELRRAVMDLVAGMMYPSLPLTADITFEVKPALRRAIAARVRNLLQALDGAGSQLPAPLPGLVAVRTEHFGLDLHQCQQYIGWCKQFEELFGLQVTHPFTQLKNTIEQAIREAQHEYVERLKAQRARA